MMVGSDQRAGRLEGPGALRLLKLPLMTAAHSDGWIGVGGAPTPL